MCNTNEKIIKDVIQIQNPSSSVKISSKKVDSKESNKNSHYIVLPNISSGWDIIRFGSKKRSAVGLSKESAISRAEELSSKYNTTYVIKEGLEEEKTNKAQYIDFKRIRGIRDVKSDIEQWSTMDFVLYLRDMMEKVFDTKLGLGYPRACRDIKDLMEELSDIFDFSVPNFLVKDYIDYFLDIYGKYCIQKSKRIYITEMINQKYILDFMHDYDLDKAYKNYLNLNKSKNEFEGILNNESIEDAFEKGIRQMLFSYGVIITINWLAMNKGYELRLIVKSVYENLYKIYSDGFFNRVKKSTEMFSPYPEFLIFKNHSKLIEKISSELVVKAFYLDNDSINERFNFLEKNL